MKKPRVSVFFGAGCLLVGWLVGGIFPPCMHPVAAQAPPGEWQLTSSQNASFAWLHNTKTGKVYRVFNGCGEAAPDGCLDPLPVVNEASSRQYMPSATQPKRVGSP